MAVRAAPVNSRRRRPRSITSAGAVDHDPADVADEGGDHGVGGVDGDAGGGLAPVPVDLARVGHRCRSAGEVGEVGFEGVCGR